MDNKPWYRHPMVWLIMVPPLAAVIGGISLLVIAHHGADEVIRDDYVKVGVAYEADTRLRDAALALGLGANVHLQRERGQVTVVLHGNPAVAPQTLTLRLVHPTDSRHDRTVVMPRVGKVYQAELEQEISGHWGVQIEPEDQAWRLSGELADEASAVALGTGG